MKTEMYNLYGVQGKRLYGCWCTMNSRCHNPNSISYKNYGGRGIKVCERWRNFENFFKDMGLPERGMSIDRIDNDGDYSPENCRWATKKEQSNNARSNVIAGAFGEKKTLADWCSDSRCNVDYATLYYRIVIAKWDPIKAITTKRYGFKTPHHNKEMK